MITREQLALMASMDIDDIDCSELVNIEHIVMKDELNHVDKMLDYIEQVKNPYCFLVGDTPVQIRFVGDRPLGDALVSYFSSLK